MRALRSVFVLTLFAVTLAPLSLAGPVQVKMKFVSVGGQSIGGEYVFPYNFSINGSHTLTSLICDTYSNSITFGESWTATKTQLLNVQGLWKGVPNARQDYEAAAILFSKILSGSVDAANGNLAIWALFDGGGKQNSGWTSYDQSLMDSALGSTSHYSSAFYDHFFVYTPVGGSPGNGPQEFIGYQAVPEPASLVLALSALVGGALLMRRRKLA